MMEQLNIKQLSRRYHLRPSQFDLEERLDETLNKAMSEYLETELMGLGIDDLEEVCLRFVRIPLSNNRQYSSQDTGKQWGQLIARNIRLLLDKNGVDVIRFRSRFHALIEFVLDVNQQNNHRLWAWNQLGLTSENDDIRSFKVLEQAVDALLSESAAILPAFVHLAAIQQLQLFFTQLSNAQLADLQDKIMLHHGVNRRWLTAHIPASIAADRQVSSPVLTDIALSRSVIFRHLQSVADPQQVFSDLSRRGWVILMLLELEPMLFRRSSSLITQALQMKETELTKRMHGSLVDGEPELNNPDDFSPGQQDNSATDKEIRMAEKLDVNDDQIINPVVNELKQEDDIFHHPVHLDTDKESKGSASEAVIDADSREALNSLADREGAAGEKEHTAEVIQSSSEETRLENDSEQSVVPNESIDTDLAGLFFLIPVLIEVTTDHEESLINQIASDPVFNSRSLCWVLYQLVDFWLSPDLDDAGLKVFCAVAINENWPWQENEKASSEEQASIEQYSTQIISALLQRLSWTNLSITTVMPYLCCRPATIDVESGWVELAFNLSSVDTDIRRAGLDLDPGYVPWIGKVVKIRYE